MQHIIALQQPLVSSVKRNGGVAIPRVHGKQQLAGRALGLRVRAVSSLPREGASLPAQSPRPRYTDQPATEPNGQPTVFNNIERMIANTFSSSQPGARGDWVEVEGCWVLRPLKTVGPPVAVAHFLGSAFLGAAPQLTYRLFLETLANRNILVITTPYQTGFDHLRVADEVQYKYDRCVHTLADELDRLPVYGIGHGMGSLIHLLINARYSVDRAGNILMSFTNKPATDSIPFLSPFIAPGARALGPLLTQLAASPLRSSLESAAEFLRGMSPSALRQALPLVEQLSPIYLDVAQGRQEFSPAPEETRNLIRSYYGVQKNLLLRFAHDKGDETNQLASMLQATGDSAAPLLDLSVRTLPGDHTRPLRQAFGDLPPELARAANQAVNSGGDFVARLSAMATQAGLSAASDRLEDLSRGMAAFAEVFGGDVGGPIVDNVQELADEVAEWMDIDRGMTPARAAHALPSAQEGAYRRD